MCSRFERANKLAREKAEEVKDKYLAIIQTGSSLRKEDFTEYSDVDLYGVKKEEPERLFDHPFEEELDVSIVQKSVPKFEEGLEQGNPFELISLKYGKVLEGDSFIKKYRQRDYGPGRETYRTWVQSSLNNYQNMLFDRYMPIEFYNSAYHSYREFSRYLVLDREGKLVEGDAMIKQHLSKISRDFAKDFWTLREKRFDPPDPSQDYIDLQDLFQAEEYQTIKKIDRIGNRVFETEDFEFPSLGRMREILEKRGLKLLLSPHYSFRKEEKFVHLSGEDKQGNHRSFYYNLESGELEKVGESD